MRRRRPALDHLLVDLRMSVREQKSNSPRTVWRAQRGSFDGVLAHAFDRAEPEADELSARLLRVRGDAEGEIGLVDVGLQDRDAVRARLSDMRHHLVRVVLLGGEQRRDELDRMVRLQPGV